MDMNVGKAKRDEWNGYFLREEKCNGKERKSRSLSKYSKKSCKFVFDL